MSENQQPVRRLAMQVNINKYICNSFIDTHAHNLRSSHILTYFSKHNCDNLNSFPKSDHSYAQLYMYNCIQMCMYTYTHARTHIDMHAPTHTHIIICMYVCMYRCMYVHTHMYVCIYICMYVCIHSFVIAILLQQCKMIIQF